MYVCGCGGNGMRCKIYYSKEENFANAVNIADFSGSMKANNMMEVKATPVLELKENETLRVRIYPWYNGSATGKTICVSDVKIGGVAVDSSTGVNTLENNKKATATYYNIYGMRQDGMKKGLNIVVENGTAKKIIK